MKHLLTLTALLVSTAIFAQLPTMPWNPDENGDQFVGLTDLLELLAVYGQEFENAIVSEDGESAIMYMGDLEYPLCALACRNLPGMWSLPNMEDLGLVWDEVNPAQDYVYAYTWLNSSESGEHAFAWYYSNPTNSGARLVETANNLNPNGSGMRCYCAARQMPRVEYKVCANNDLSSFIACADSWVAAGWYPLDYGPQFKTTSDIRYSQAFWRWAE